MEAKQLSGKVAIVTGGGSGIGRAVALGLAREGASVAVADIDRQRADAVAAEIAESGEAIGVAVDVSNADQVNAMVEETVERFGRLDILINNAGRATRGYVGQMTDEDWDAVIAVNLRGTFLCSRAAVAHMIPERSGRIVNTASGIGLRGLAGGTAFGASKAAIINFTKSLALEVARYSITVNAIAPGVTDTLFLAGIPQRGGDQGVVRTRTGWPARGFRVAGRLPLHKGGRCALRYNG